MSNIENLVSQTKNFNIILVEDDEYCQESLNKFFERFFNEVFIGNNGEEGLEQFMLNPEVKIVFSDIIMPKMDGIEMAKLIHKVDENVHIIFISASKEEYIKNLEFNYTFIEKPIVYEKILSCLEELVVSIKANH